MPKIFALVPAAGQGTRLGDAVPKQYLPIAGKPMMFHSVETLAGIARIEAVLVILSPLDRHWGAHDWSALPDKVEPVFQGGSSRGASVRNALAWLKGRAQRDDWILVHDAARPCVARSLVEQFLDEIDDDPVGGLLAVPVADTLKRGDDTQRVEETVSRSRLWRAQTPQMFRYEALARGLDRQPDATDEAQAMEAVGQLPRLVKGHNLNIKVTFAEDVRMAEAILALQREAEEGGTNP